LNLELAALNRLRVLNFKNFYKGEFNLEFDEINTIGFLPQPTFFKLKYSKNIQDLDLVRPPYGK